MPDDPTTGRRSAFDRFLAKPASLLVASLAIICVTAATVLLGALVIYLYDESEFATYGEALWFTLQTATTVGYGDMTPERPIGRIVAAAVMLVSLALLTVMTATLTSYFIKRSTHAGFQSDHDEITTALAELKASVLALRDQVDEVRREIPRTDGAAHISMDTAERHPSRDVGRW